jgi:hypothetical protein
MEPIRWQVEDPLGRPLAFRRFTSYVVYVAAAMIVAGRLIGFIEEGGGLADD